MIDPGQLGSDITGISVGLLTAPLLWLFLFLWAWDRPAQAEAVGFGQRTFWLLLPGAVLASLANAPFFGWDGSILAVNIGGALIPLVLAILFLRHWERAEPRSVLPGFLLAFGGLCAVLFGLVVVPVGANAPLLGFSAVLLAPAVAGGSPSWLILVSAAAFPIGAGMAAVATPDPVVRIRRRRLAGLLLLTTAALLSTFFTSSAVAGVGILSQFPSYLYGPIAIGVVSPLLAKPVFRLPAGAGIGIAFAATTFGVLMGADLLHEPPLYGAGAGLLSIGGAGVGDLVYLSGLLAAAVAFPIVMLFARRDSAAWGSAPAPRALTSIAQWRQAVRLHTKQQFPAAIAAADVAVAQAERDYQQVWQVVPPTPTTPSWNVPGPLWLTIDRWNLAALARQESADFRDSARALLASRGLVEHAAREARARFASFSQRMLAFLVDLLVLTIPAIAAWIVLAELLVRGIGSPIYYATAIFAYLAYAFLYFVVAETSRGATLGKRVENLEVRDRAHRLPGIVPALLRSSTKLPILFIIGLVSGIGILLLFGLSLSGFGLFGVAFGLLVVALLIIEAAFPLVLIALVTFASMYLTVERQRVGDLWAGTWVIQHNEGSGTRSLPAGLSPTWVG